MTANTMLLISGPSGGGKSTFIRQFTDGSLAPEILSLLPRPAADWPIIEANDVLKGIPVAENVKSQAPGALVHYDIVFIHRYGISRYEDDPALAMLDDARSLHVVFVRPESGVVSAQFLERQNRHRQTKSKASLLWSRFFRLPARRLLSPLTGRTTLSTENIYRDDKWLAAIYVQWETFIHRLVAQHPDAKLTIVEPSGEAQEFRLRTDPHP
jgi:hypothetical protein